MCFGHQGAAVVVLASCCRNRLEEMDMNLSGPDPERSPAHDLSGPVDHRRDDGRLCCYGEHERAFLELAQAVLLTAGSFREDDDVLALGYGGSGFAVGLERGFAVLTID